MRDMSVTLHRAFDMCRDPFAALEESDFLGYSNHSDLWSGSAVCTASICSINSIRQLMAESISPLAGAGVSAKTVMLS